MDEHHEMLTQSPFAMLQEDVKALEESPAFTVLRSYLADDAEFCAHHETQCDADTKKTWRLHRDILHALIMPVVALFSRASSLASAALCSPKPSDLELAFAGDARSAFLCLQCFITEETDWCQTRGCPACVVTEAISTESHIRLTIAASLLSTTSVSSATTEESPDIDRSLPPLPHILPALRAALAEDPFWQSEHDAWPYLLSRATQLSASIQALISECVNLESLVSSPITQGSESMNALKRGFTHPVPFVAASSAAVEEKGAKLRKSKLAKRQLRLRDEEVALMQRVVMQCWAKAKMPKQMRGEILGVGKSNRSRSLTCP